jgi:hypothetical protein
VLETCTYSFIHSVKRNNLNADRAEILVYVHYNLRLLSHYCDAERNAFCKRDMTWDNNPEETNLQDGTIVLERLQEELLSDHDGDHIPGGDMPPHPLQGFQIHQFYLYLHNVHCHVGAIQRLVVFHDHFHLFLLLFKDHGRRN